MVLEAIKELNQRNGSSLQAIKKYIQQYYNTDLKNINFHLHKYLKTAIDSGSIIRTKGRGVLGYFKIGKLDKKPAVQKTGRRPSVKKKSLSNSSLKSAKKTSSVKLGAKNNPIKPSCSSLSRSASESSSSKFVMSRSESEVSRSILEVIPVNRSERLTRAGAKRINL
ncbi:hypothetical protein O3M35_010745 [Rhynocoris fuscipes]|uniref:H15 domain-containing protein n=1 Tax=Rhynocoris fuscipes TaxID=488301 RepID=A0AAW1D1J2_9HEMI